MAKKTGEGWGGKVGGKSLGNTSAARIRRYSKVLVGQDVERKLAGKIIGIIFVVVVPLLSALSSEGNRGSYCFFGADLANLS